MAEYNFTDSFTITDLKPEKTLEGSQLVKINVKEASEDEITKTFCREVCKFIIKAIITLCYVYDMYHIYSSSIQLTNRSKLFHWSMRDLSREKQTLYKSLDGWRPLLPF